MSVVPQTPASGIDLDSQETREWMDALSAVIDQKGLSARISFLSNCWDMRGRKTSICRFRQRRPM